MERFTEKSEGVGQPAIFVSRTGPFVPPITLPFGRVLVTDDFRHKRLAERFSGLSFEPVGYRKVVNIAWEQWDAKAQEPGFYPETGEPEDYLLQGAHDEQLAATMPRLWAWNVAPTVSLQVQVWISERMKLWLEVNARKWLSFVAVVPR